MKKLGTLAFEARFVALAICALVVTTSCVFRYPSEPHIRWSGTLLLYLGLFLVVCQLWSIAKEFDHQSPLHGFLDWLNRVRLAITPLPTVTGVGVIQMEDTVLSARGSVTDATADLATQLADLRREVEDRWEADDARHQALLERLDKEGDVQLARTASLEAAHRTLGARVEALAVGDLFTAIIGLGLTIVGTFETGFAPEIACVIGG